MANLLVRIVGETGDLDRKLAETAHKLGKFGQSGDSAGKKLAGLGKIAAAGIAGAAVAVGGVAIKAALEGQQAHALLVNAVKNSGHAFKDFGDAVDGQSEKLAKFGF